MRLTKAIREDAYDKIYALLYAKERHHQRDILTNIAENAAYNFYPIKVAQWMGKGPTGAFNATPSVHLELKNGSVISNPGLEDVPARGWHDQRNKFKLKEPMKLLACDSQIRNLRVPASENKLALDCLAELDKLQASRLSDMSKINDALLACSTFATLERDYPDLAAYLPKQEKPKKLPMVQPESISQILQTVKKVA